MKGFHVEPQKADIGGSRMPRKRPDIAYRPCETGCGNRVCGRTKLCSECAPVCIGCGLRARTGKATCYACSREGGPPDTAPVVWRKNRRGIFVAVR